MKGWVYIMSNKAMPGIVKIGYSTKDPKLRAEELSHTGSPHPYNVEYEILIEEPFQIEQKLHKALSAQREGKEWFHCSVSDAIAVIKNNIVVSKIIYENSHGLREIKPEKTETNHPMPHRDTLKIRMEGPLERCPAEVFKKDNAGIVMFKDYTFAYVDDIYNHDLKNVISEVKFKQMFQYYDFIKHCKEKGERIFYLSRKCFIEDALAWLLTTKRKF
jgi:hypothetical protein